METKQKLIAIIQRCRNEEKIKIIYQFAAGLLNDAATGSSREERKRSAENHN